MIVRKRIAHTAAAIWSRLPSALLAWVIVALIVRLTIRDRLPVLSVLFYMTPLIVSAVLAGIAALLCLRRRRWRLAGVAGALALATGVWWHFSAYAHHPVSSGPAGARIVFWNTCRGGAGWAAVADQLRGFDADLIGLVEAGPHDAEMERFWRDRFSEFQVSGPKEGMVLLAKGSVIEKESGDLGGGSEYCQYEVP